MAAVRQVSEVNVTPLSQQFQCSNCGQPSVSSCSRCSAIRYCGKECQEAQWPSHKSICKEIKTQKNKTDQEADPLRNYVHFGGRRPTNIFQTDVGHFWGFVDPRDYCRARFFWAVALHKCGTKNNSLLALELATEHLFDLMWLCRGDNLGARFLLANVLLDQNKLQDAYDFIKWWQVCDPDGHYDWGDTTLPYLNLHGENMFEDLEELQLNKYTSCQWLAPLTLIKIKLQLELVAEKQRFDSFLLGTHDRVGEESPVRMIRGWLYSVDRKFNEKLGRLRDQIKNMTKKMHLANRHLIPSLLNPGNLLSQPCPEYHSAGSLEEVWGVIQEGINSWNKTPGALEELKKLKQEM